MGAKDQSKQSGKGIQKTNVRLFSIGVRFMNSIRQEGMARTGKKIQRKLADRFGPRAYRSSYKLRPKERKRQQEAVFSRRPLISILVPIYNTPLSFLKDMISSVQRQTYPHWELCLCDGSTEAHLEVSETILALAGQDQRIRYKKLSENRGISENTNACMEMAGGEYFALLDHDDMLHPSALYWVACAIESHNADFIYTDEGTFSKRPKDMYLPHFKPDYAPDTLRGNNYICHLTVFSRALSAKVGRVQKRMRRKPGF